MKRLIGFMVIAVLATGSLFAQQRAPQQREQRTPPETVTVNGTLKLEKGIVAIQSGEKTHLIPLLNRYIGFIVGLQEGKTVSVEGFAGRNMLHPKKLTIDGREYDFSRRMLARENSHTKSQKHRGHERNREDRPNRGERSRRQAPASSSQVITDQV